tara:strand:- start:124 stop:465 length:342 start_codon:yes stop_codon:yes gene_type:complete
MDLDPFNPGFLRKPGDFHCNTSPFLRIYRIFNKSISQQCVVGFSTSTRYFIRLDWGIRLQIGPRILSERQSRIFLRAYANLVGTVDLVVEPYINKRRRHIFNVFLFLDGNKFR